MTEGTRLLLVTEIDGDRFKLLNFSHYVHEIVNDEQNIYLKSIKIMRTGCAALDIKPNILRPNIVKARNSQLQMKPVF